MATFADMLVYLRKREGLSQQALADRIKLTRSAVSMYETGQREPDFETLEVFADFFNVNLDVLLGKAHTENKKAPAETDESLSEDKRYLVDKIMSLTDEEVRRLRTIVDQVLALRG